MKISSVVTIDYGGYTSSISKPLEGFQKGFGAIIENSLKMHSSSDCTGKKNNINFSSGRLGEFYTEKTRQINTTSQKGATVNNSGGRKRSKRGRFEMHSLQSFTKNT